MTPISTRQTGWRRLRTRRTDPVPEINVTPLVDIVLVLLIIFMVVAPRLDADIPVTLPGVFHPDPSTGMPARPLVVTVKAPGEYYVDSRRYSLDGLVEHLGSLHGADPLRRLELRADAKLKYKEIRHLYQQAHQLGFPGVSFVVSPLSRGEAEMS